MIDSNWNTMSFEGRISRLPYFAIGLALTIFKQVIDRMVAAGLFGRPWSPMSYALTGEVEGLFSLDRDEQFFYLIMLGIALPFLAIGLVLTVRRLRDAAWPIWLVCLFFAPLPINLIFLLVLSLVPGVPVTMPGPVVDVMDVPEVGKPSPGGFPKGVRPSTDGFSFSWAMAAILIPMPLAGLVAYVVTHFFGDYGWSLFVGLPFVLPMLSVIIYGHNRRPSLSQSLAVGSLWLFCSYLIMLATAFEGMICLLMALPLVAPIALFGALIGHCLVAPGHARPRELGRTVVLLLAVLPTMVGAEHLTKPEPPLFACRTSIEVDAPPDRVWRHVVSFPDLETPDDFLFRSGVAYPIRARIEGQGVGAVRHCEFSTGAFVEPIEIWDEARLLRFAVTSCPPPMREWNPFFEVHPPHLEGFLVSEQGQFHLIELPGGRTRLEGTTWYHHGLWPATYWRLWSDPILHRIHARVLNHIKTLAENDANGAG
jgi:uncharacterized membrane protein YhaH (DUF805 family)